MTQAQVARAFGRPQSFVSKCESGERRVDVLELGEFAELYGRPLSFFVAEGERATSGAGMTRDAATRRRRKPAAPRRRKS